MGQARLTVRKAEKILALLESGWCQGMEAADADGNPVNFDSRFARKWDVIGAAYRALGPTEADHILYKLLWVITGNPIETTNPFCKLRDWNDSDEADQEYIVLRIKAYISRCQESSSALKEKRQNGDL